MRSVFFFLSFLLFLGVMSTAQADEALHALQKIRLEQGANAAAPYAEALVRVAPRNVAYLFERGVIEAEQGQCVQAWRTFHRALQLSGLISIRQARDQALQELCPQIAGWSGSLSLALIHDPNRNRVTSNDTVVIRGVPFVLNDDAKQQKRYGFSFTGDVAYTAAMSQETALVFSLDVAQDILNVPEDNVGLVKVGVAYQHERPGVVWTVGPYRTWYSEGQRVETTDLGAEGSLLVSLSPRQNVRGTLSYSQQSGSRQNTGETLSGRVSYLHVLGQSRLVVGLSFRDETRDVASNAFDSVRLDAAYQMSLTPTTGITLFASHTNKDADARDPLFGKTRRDKQTEAGFTVSFSGLRTPIGQPYLGLARTQNTSTIDYYAFGTNRVLFGVSQQF